MKRFITGLLVLLIIAAGIVASLPLLVSSDSVRNAITSSMEELTGRKVAFRGDPEVSFQPFLGVEISDLVIADPHAEPDAAPLLHVENVNAKLDIFPALIGKVQIHSYELVRPRLHLTVHTNGKTNWTFEHGRLQDAISKTDTNRTGDTSVEVQNTQLGEFSIKDGIVEYEDRISDTTENITGINGRFEWPETDGAMMVSGNAIWRGEGVTTKIDIANPLEILSGGLSPLNVEFNSQPLRFNFSGSANMFSDLFVKGSLASSSPSISRLAEVLAIDIGRFQSFDNWSATGQLEASINDMNLSEAEITIGENSGSGVVRLSKNEVGKSKLDGTLAFDAIDASSYFVKAEANSNSGFSTFGSDDLQIDLRISANTLETGIAVLENVAAAINVNNGSWTFDIGESTAFGGSLVGKVGERTEGEKRQAFLEISAKDMDASSISELVGSQLVGVSGTTTFNANLRTNSLDDGFFTRGLNGSVESRFQDGAITGIDLPALLRAQQGANQQEGIGFRENASTGFSSMSVNFFLNNGIAAVSKSSIQSGDMTIQVIGDADLHKGNLALRAQEISPDGPVDERLFIGGTILDPLVSLKRGPPLPTTQEDSQAEQDDDASN